MTHFVAKDFRDNIQGINWHLLALLSCNYDVFNVRPLIDIVVLLHCKRSFLLET